MTFYKIATNNKFIKIYFSLVLISAIIGFVDFILGTEKVLELGIIYLLFESIMGISLFVLSLIAIYKFKDNKYPRIFLSLPIIEIAGLVILTFIGSILSLQGSNFEETVSSNINVYMSLFISILELFLSVYILTKYRNIKIKEKKVSFKNKEEGNHGLAIASLVLGIISFIPLIGLLLGLLAIIFGIISLVQIKKRKLSGKGLAITGIVLGVLGMLFTVFIYGSLYYLVFVAEDGPFLEGKIMASKQILTQDAGLIELYKQKYGRYPSSLEEAIEKEYTIFGSDHFLKPFYYNVSEDGQSYVLKSAGSDKEYNTEDDIFPNI